MTRKRFVKLLMSHGITRNEAHKTANRYNARNFSYKRAYRNFLLVHGFKQGFKKVSEAFKIASSSIRQASASFDELMEAYK